MSTTVIGIIVIIVGGLIILGIAAVADRRSRQRLEGSASGQTTPAVTASKLLRDAAKPTQLSPTEEQKLLETLDAADTQVLALHLASDGFATHTGVRSIVDEPQILVCADAVSSARELFRTLGLAATNHWKLVVAAPSIDPAAVDELLANHIAGNVFVQALTGPSDELTKLASATGATPTSFVDRQADDIPESTLGTAHQIVADLQHTWVL
jgi:hypothetical protein